MGDPQQQQDLSHLVPVDQDGAPSTPPQSHAEAAPLDKPQPSEDSAQDLSKLQPVDGSQRDVQPDLSKLEPVEGTQRQVNQVNPNVRTGGHAVSPSGVVRDDYGTNQHDEFLSGPGAGGTTISPAEHGFHAWLQDLQSDVRNGSDNTWFGAMLKKLGSKGTGYGVSEGTANAMESINPLAGVPSGLAGMGEHSIDLLRADKGVAKYVAQGHDLGTAVQLAYNDDPNLFKKNAIAINGVLAGAFKAAGPVTALVAPEATLAATPTITAGMVAQHVATKTAIAMGMDPDEAELVGNVAMLGTAHIANAKINPLTKRFGAAVNDRTAAEAEYNNRVRNLETARGQQVQAQSDALKAAQQEAKTHSDPKSTPEQKKSATDATVAARQNANDAAGNVTDAQKAHDVATKNRADSIVQLEGLHRQIRTIADIENDKFDDQFTTESDKAKDLFQKAVPSKGAHQYTPEDYDVWRGYMENAKKAGAKINNFDDAYSATEAQRLGIEKSLDPAVEKLKDNPITTNPFMDVQNGLAEAAKIEPGIQQEAADELSKYNLKDLTVGEARETIKRFNSQNRSAMKDKNNWDVNDMMAKDPAFAARYLAVDSLREGFYGALKDAGVDGAEEARKEESSLIKVREAIGAQRRANRGGVTVRGSGNQNKLRAALANLTAKGIKAYAIAKGAVLGGEKGALLGHTAGEAIAEPISDLISPRDVTRDEHIQKSMELRGTLRQPTRIRGIEGATPNRPNFELPPEVAEQMPTAVARVPRENTELHAELAAHYLDANGEYTYQQLEDRLRKDVSVKAANDPASVTPAEKTLLAKVIKLDKVDAAAIAKSNETITPSKPTEPTTTEQKKDLKAEQTAAAAKVPGTNPANVEINPTLRAQGRGDESALVSHSPAMKAYAPALEIGDLADGVNSEDVHREEWSHAALAAVDGLQPLEIRSDLHPKAAEGAAATTAIAADQIKDENGKYDPEMLKHQLTQWVTQKMAGPASHEVFRGATREELKSGVTNAADYREARQLVREVYPDWTTKQVNDYVDAGYDRAHNFLTQEHIADRIRANASVREEGLPETLHASRGRLNQFAEDIRKAHNDAEGNDAGPDGGGTGEGSEKPAQKPESGAAGKAEDGEKKNEGRDSGRSEKEPRGDDGKGSNASGSAKSPEVVSKSSKGYKPSEKAETLSGEAKDYGPEFNAAQQQHQIDLYKSIARNPKATPEEKTFARERLFDLQNPDLREVTSAANKKNNSLDDYITNAKKVDGVKIFSKGKYEGGNGSALLMNDGRWVTGDLQQEAEGYEGEDALVGHPALAEATGGEKKLFSTGPVVRVVSPREFDFIGTPTSEQIQEIARFSKGERNLTWDVRNTEGKNIKSGQGSLGDLQRSFAEEGSNALRKSQIPPERTTGDEARDSAIRAGGGIPGGSMGDIALFHSPSTGSTLALKHADITPELVKSHIASSDAQFGPEQKLAPEESSQARKNLDDETSLQPVGETFDGKKIKVNGHVLSKDGKPLAVIEKSDGGWTAHKIQESGKRQEYTWKTRQAVIDWANEHFADNPAEESSQARKKSSEVLADIQRSYGAHDDPKIERSAGFITPDAKYIDLPVTHEEAIEEHGGPKAGGAKDNRKDFINDTGAIRVHTSKENGRNVLAFAVPKDGVTEEQADAMARSFGKNGDRNGVLRIERADISPETRNTLSTEQEFPSASQVKPMLRKIDALQEEASKANKGGSVNEPIKRVSGDEVIKHIMETSKIHNEQDAHQLAGLDSAGEYDLRDVPVDKLTYSNDVENDNVKDYASRSTPIPAVVLDGDGRLRDGNHRLAAARARGEKTIKAYVPVDSTTNKSANFIEKPVTNPFTEEELNDLRQAYDEKSGLDKQPSNVVDSRKRQIKGAFGEK